MYFMRADRLLSLLMILQLRGRTTAGDLSTQLEVSVRTVYRDIEALTRSGVQVHADRGRIGRVRLAHGYRDQVDWAFCGRSTGATVRQRVLVRANQRSD
ncbi:MAG: helix-turn-helix domain-containing protein [Terracidiphilus sp.]